MSAATVAVVTGAASGIGRASALALAARGHRVVGLDLGFAAGQEEGIVAVPCDVTDRAAVARAMDEAASLGAITVVVTSAGIYRPDAFIDAIDSDFDLMFDVNVRGTFLVAQEAARRMPEDSDGVIVTVSSVAASEATETNGIYSATKGAVSALTRAMAVSLGERGIRVVGVAPGPIATPMGDKAAADPVYRDRMLSRVITQRFAAPEDVAAAIVMLADPSMAHVTGHVLPVDGGVLAKR